MNGRISKKLRKQAKYEKTHNTKVVGDKNIQIATGKATIIKNIPKTEPAPISEVEKVAKAQYKKLKREYKAV